MDLAENYARGGFDWHLPFGDRPALVIVDVCMAYLEPSSPLYADVEDALASNIRLAAAARAAGIQVIFTRVVYGPDGLDGGLFFKKVRVLASFIEGNPLADFADSLRPEPGELVVTKQYASAFFGTSLASTLRAMGVDTVMITGFSTSGCVRASALDALQHGFTPFVIREACGDRATEPHESNLFDLQAKYAEVVSEVQAVALMQGCAGRG